MSPINTTLEEHKRWIYFLYHSMMLNVLGISIYIYIYKNLLLYFGQCLGLKWHFFLRPLLK